MCNNDKHTLWYLFHTDKLLLKQTEAEKLSLPTEQEVETFKPYFVGTIHSFTAPNACECQTVSMNLPNEMGDEWVKLEAEIERLQTLLAEVNQ